MASRNETEECSSISDSEEDLDLGAIFHSEKKKPHASEKDIPFLPGNLHHHFVLMLQDDCRRFGRLCDVPGYHPRMHAKSGDDLSAPDPTLKHPDEATVLKKRKLILDSELVSAHKNLETN